MTLRPHPCLFAGRFLPYSNWSTALDASGWPTSPGVFYAALDDFLNSISGAIYKDNLALLRGAAPGNPIVGVQSARMQGFYVPLNNTYDFVHAMLESREKVAEVPQVRDGMVGLKGLGSGTCQSETCG